MQSNITENPPLSLAHKVLITLGKLAQRADVSVDIRTSFNESLSEKWIQKLPSDMAAFFRQINGIYYAWSFLDEQTIQGIYFHHLQENGKKIVNQKTGFFSLPCFSTTGKVAKELPLLDQNGAKWKTKGEAIFFEGTQDSKGTFLFIDKTGEQTIYDWSNDGEALKIADSFSEYIEQCIRNKFAGSASNILERLNESTKLRTPFEVSIEAIESIDHSVLLEYNGNKLFSKHFDAIMKAFGRKERAAKHSNTKGAVFSELFDDLASITEAQAAIILAGFGFSNGTKEQLVSFFHLNTALTRLDIGLKYKPTEGIPNAKDYDGWKDKRTLARAISLVPELKKLIQQPPFHPDLIPFVQEHHNHSWTPFVACIHTEHNNRQRKTVFSVLYPTDVTTELQTGNKFMSTAPPVVPTVFNKVLLEHPKLVETN